MQPNLLQYLQFGMLIRYSRSRALTISSYMQASIGINLHFYLTFIMIYSIISIESRVKGPDSAIIKL